MFNVPLRTARNRTESRLLIDALVWLFTLPTSADDHPRLDVLGTIRLAMFCKALRLAESLVGDFGFESLLATLTDTNEHLVQMVNRPLNL